MTVRVSQAHDPKPVHSPDRVPRKEVYEKTWATLDLGTLELPMGSARLDVRAATIAGEQVMDLKAVVVERIE